MMIKYFRADDAFCQRICVIFHPSPLLHPLFGILYVHRSQLAYDEYFSSYQFNKYVCDAVELLLALLGFFFEGFMVFGVADE